jgi:TIR domain
MAHQVFICHSSTDKPIADAACAALESQRIRCWIAPRDIIPGEEFGKSIIEALSSCQVVVLIFSKTANDSPQVHREIERAVSKGKIILPFRIEDILPSYAMEFAISNSHWLDAITPPMERRLTELCDSIAHLLKRHHSALWPSPPAETPATETPATEKATPGPPPPPSSVRTCTVCGKQFPVVHQYCPNDGSPLSLTHHPSAPPPQDTQPAHISLFARPKVTMGFLNSVDIVNAIVVNIDGKIHERRWGQHVFDLSPGPHRLIVGVRNFVYSSMKCPGELQVNLRAGVTTYLRYTAGLTVFTNGTLEIDPQPPAVAPRTASATSDTKQCRSCNQTIPRAGAFCRVCGQKQY